MLDLIIFANSIIFYQPLMWRSVCPVSFAYKSDPLIYLCQISCFCIVILCCSTTMSNWRVLLLDFSWPSRSSTWGMTKAFKYISPESKWQLFCNLIEFDTGVTIGGCSLQWLQIYSVYTPHAFLLPWIPS